MVDEIGADRSVSAQRRRDERFGSDSVRRSNQGAALVAGQPERAGKRADPLELRGMPPAGGDITIPFDRLVRRIDIDA
jgi:hypothetical protein